MRRARPAIASLCATLLPLLGACPEERTKAPERAASPGAVARPKAPAPGAPPPSASAADEKTGAPAPKAKAKPAAKAPKAAAEPDAGGARAAGDPALPAHWKVLRDDRLGPANRGAIAGRLGGIVVAVRDRVFDVGGGKRLQLNTITAADDGNASKIEATLRRTRPAEAFLRRGRTIHEFVDEGEVMAEVRAGRATLAAADTGEPLAIRWSAKLGLASLDQTRAALERRASKVIGRVSNKAGERAELRSCADAVARRAQGFRARAEGDADPYLLRCRPLQLLRKARPARRSHVAGVSGGDDGLRAALGERGARPAAVTLLAWADLDRDGLEDLLVHVADPSGKAALAQLTRRRAGGPLRVLSVER